MKGMKHMVAALLTIDKIIESPTKKLSKTQAEEVLRSCGILDKNNNIKPVYKDILTKGTAQKNDHK